LSLMYVAAYMMHGKLPWSRLKTDKTNKVKSYKRILRAKQMYPGAKLFQYAPVQFATIFAYLESLRFEE
jgi:hypothetical protein